MGDATFPGTRHSCWNHEVAAAPTECAWTPVGRNAVRPPVPAFGPESWLLRLLPPAALGGPAPKTNSKKNPPLSAGTEEPLSSWGLADVTGLSCTHSWGASR